jgi:uncharacterized protein
MDQGRKRIWVPKRIGIVIGLLCAFCLIAFLCAGWYFSDLLYARGLNPDRPYHSEPFALDILPSQKILYSSDIGNFDAYYLANKKKNWVILVHGNGMRLIDTRKFAISFNNLGYPTMVISFRNDKNQPRDPSGMMRYGITEWKEVEGAVTYAIAHGSGPVILFGMSMGGGIVMSFMHHSKLAEKVTGLVLDAPMLDFGKAVDINAAREKIPGTGIFVPQSLTDLAKLISFFRFDLKWNELNYLEAAGSLNLPVMLFHGQADAIVPVSTSDQFYEMKRNLVFRYIRKKEAGHCETWNVDPADYERNLKDFLESVFH